MVFKLTIVTGINVLFHSGIKKQNQWKLFTFACECRDKNYKSTKSRSQINWSHQLISQTNRTTQSSHPTTQSNQPIRLVNQPPNFKLSKQISQNQSVMLHEVSVFGLDAFLRVQVWEHELSIEPNTGIDAFRFQIYV